MPKCLIASFLIDEIWGVLSDSCQISCFEILKRILWLPYIWTDYRRGRLNKVKYDDIIKWLQKNYMLKARASEQANIMTVTEDGKDL